MAQWTDITFSFEEVLTASRMNNLDANFDALAEGAAGAPAIQTAAIAAGAVTYAKLSLTNDIVAGDIAAGAVGQSEVAAAAIGQGELKTAEGSVSITGSADSSNLTLPGGAYGFYPRSTTSTDTDRRMDAQIADTFQSTSNVANVWLRAYNDPGGDNFGQLTQRYIQSSPPYDLGDGECGLFIEADVRPDGSIAHLYIAPDPVWANNGPTDIHADRTDKKTGRKYKRVRRPAVTMAEVDAGTADLADYIAAQAEATVEEFEITHAYKNADMDVVPFSLLSPPDGTICLLDPVNTHDLLMLHETGEDVAELMHKGYIRIGDEVQRKGPTGVVPVTFKWKAS